MKDNGDTVSICGSNDIPSWPLAMGARWSEFVANIQKDLTREEKAQAEREVKQLEQAADRRISASFRIIAVLAVLVWIFLGVTMILEMFGINWVSTLSSRAKAYWSNPAVENQHNTPSRSDMLRNMGNNLRR